MQCARCGSLWHAWCVRCTGCVRCGVSWHLIQTAFNCHLIVRLVLVLQTELSVMPCVMFVGIFTLAIHWEMCWLNIQNYCRCLHFCCSWIIGCTMRNHIKCRLLGQITRHLISKLISRDSGVETTVIWKWPSVSSTVCHLYVHCESKKGATVTITITLPVLDWFAKFFYCCKEH